MKGFILAAGFGKRLSPITESTPKPLLPVGNLPLIGYSLKLLAHHGINEVIINVHHHGKQIRDALGKGRNYGVKIIYSEEDEILGTGGGLKRMYELLSEETFVVVNSDTIIDVDLKQAINHHRYSGALATMVLRQDENQNEFGQIEVDATGRIRRILGQGANSESLKAYMFAGVHILEPRFLDYIPLEVNTCINRYAYMKALDNDEVLNSYIVDGYFADAGTPQRYFQANLDVLEQNVKLAHADPLAGFAISPRRAVAEVVRMGKDVELSPGVNIVPPVLLGNGVRLAEGVRVGPYAILQDDVHVGHHAELHHCIALKDARIDAESEIAWQLVSRKSSLPLGN
ncbi:MAG: NDP-sugar synthase [Deltaproteobacteria bacterium]|nr:NDP-sugar synthase [Deltaproteobacteria bacterium]